MRRASTIRTDVCLSWVGSAGEEQRIAFVALKIDPVFFDSRARYFLEYHFLRSVVHAGLAKIVHWSAAVARLYVGEDKGALRKLAKLVLRPFRFALYKLSDTCTEHSFIVFERLDLILHRRHLLLCLKRGVLDIEDPFLERLERIGELRIIPCCDCRFREIEKRFGAAERSADRSNVHEGSLCFQTDGVGTSDSKRGANPHPNRREVH